MSIEDNRILFGGDLGSEFEITHGCKSLGEVLLKKFTAAEDKIVLVDSVSGQKMSARELKVNTVRLARCLQKIFNITEGDKISVCSENRFEFAITLHATILLGATLSPLSTTYSEGELHHSLTLSKPTLVFCSLNQFEKVYKVQKQCSFVRKVIVFDDIETDVERINEFDEVVTFRRFMNSNEVTDEDQEFVCKSQNMRERVALVLCSSGTTGLPKGVQLTQYNLLVAAVQYFKRPHDTENAFNDERIIIGILPWFHAFGITIFTVMAIHTTKIVFLPKFEEKLFLSSIEKYRANTTYMAPPVMVLLSKSPVVDHYDLSSLKVIWCGAAPLSKELEMAVQKRLGIQAIRQGYGMTEGTLAFCLQTDHCHSFGSVGCLNAGVWGRVIDPETGSLLGVKERGEIHFKGDCVMRGYIGNQQATNATIDRDGWLHTGDVGYYDENGEWFIVDRLKELIKYKGYQVPPAELEAILLTHDGIKDAAVIGIPDAVAGEMAFAFVVKQPNVSLTEKEVYDYVADRVSRPKRLHGGVTFIAEIPKNATGKILRRDLRDFFKTQKSKL